MGILNSLRTEIGKLFSTKTIIFTLIGLLLIPIVYAAILLSSTWGPYDYKDNLPVAVVNNDKGAVSDGEQINVGNDLVETLKEGKALGWDFVSSEEAKKGLDSNKYYMVIEIPEDFSQKVTTVLDANPQVPELRYIRNEGMNFMASQVTNSAAEKIREQLGDKITATFATKVFSRFPDIADGFLSGADGAKQIKDGTIQLSEGTNTMLSSLQQKAPDINRLAAGAKTAKDGANTLYTSVKGGTSSVNKLNDGANTLATKVSEGTTGVNALDSGAKELATKVSGGTESINALNTGAGDIVAGVEELNSQVKAKLSTINTDKALANTIEALATDVITVSATFSQINTEGISEATTGAAQVLGGLKSFLPFVNTGAMTSEQKQMYDLLVAKIDDLTGPLTNIGNSINSQAVTTAKSKAASLFQLNPQQDPSNPYDDYLPNGNLLNTISGVQGFKNEVLEGLTAFDIATNGKSDGVYDNNGARDLLIGTKKLSAGTNSLKGSWTTLADGTKQLSAGTNSLKGSWTTLADGTKQLSAGTNQLVGSWTKLSNGAGSLASGLTQIADGNQTVASGWKTLIDGTTQLNDGAGKLRDGSEQLATGLDGGYDQVSAVKVSDNNINMFASPVNLVGEDVNKYEYYRDSTAPYILSLALFVTLLISSFFIDFKKPATTPGSAISWFLSKWVTLALFAVVQALLVSLFVLLALKLSVANPGLFILFAIFVSVTFMSIILFFVSIGQRIGRFLALAFIVLQLSITGANLPIPMLPDNLGSLAKFLPLTYSNGGFKAAISLGDTSLLGQNATVLLVYLIVTSLLALAIFLISFKSLKEPEVQAEI